MDDYLPLQLETGLLEALDVVPERSRRISTTEDVLVQVQTPDEILVLPGLTQTRQLNIHGTVVVKHIIALAEESSKFANTDVLTHLKLGDLVILGTGNITVVHAENAALLVRHTSLAKSIVTPGGLVFSNGKSSNLSTVVQTGELGQGTPATADIQHSLALLQTDLLADNSHLVILHLLEGLFLLSVRDNTRGVDHARTEEPSVVIVTAIVVGANLLLILSLGVEDNIHEEGEDDELEQLRGEGEVGPIVTVLKNLEKVTVEVNQTIQVHLSKSNQGNLVSSAPFSLVLLALEGDVMLNRTTGQLDLAVGAGTEGGGICPEGDQEGENQNDSKEDECLLSSAKQVGQKTRDTDQDGTKDNVREALISGAISGEGGIVNSWRLYEMVSQVQLRKDAGQWLELTLVKAMPQSSPVPNSAGLAAGVLMKSISPDSSAPGAPILYLN